MLGADTVIVVDPQQVSAGFSENGGRKLFEIVPADVPLKHRPAVGIGEVVVQQVVGRLKRQIGFKHQAVTCVGGEFPILDVSA